MEFEASIWREKTEDVFGPGAVEEVYDIVEGRFRGA